MRTVFIDSSAVGAAIGREKAPLAKEPRKLPSGIK
jgi:hypothetical protein